MLGFLIGLLVGGCVGIIATALAHVASESDRRLEDHNIKTEA